MGRKPCCEKVGLKRGPWTAEEDKKLVSFINTHGISCWRAVPKLAGLLRCGKSCRLRWTNYLRPDLKRGILTEAEENLILELHATLGNRWSQIAVRLPGRTDNEIKNFWNTRLKKRLRGMGLDPNTHKPVESSDSTHMDQSSVDSNLEERPRSPAPTSPTRINQHSEHTPDQPAWPPSLHLPEDVASLEGGPVSGNALMNMGQSYKSVPTITNTKQDPQSSHSDLLSSNPKHEQPSDPSHLKNFHMAPSLGPKVEDSFTNDLYPHANYIWQNSSHEVAVAAGTSSGGIFQDMDVGAVESLLNRQPSGFGFSDWSSLGEVIHGQAPSCSTSLISSWSDFLGAHGRPLQELELQKLAAVLDQM